MRRILASLILVTTFVIVAATARADSSTPSTSLASSTPPATVPTTSSPPFSLLEPGTWRMPQYDWHSFKIQDPNSWPFIPVPEVATDPNGGVTYGVLPVWLFTDDKNESAASWRPISTPTARSGLAETFATWHIRRRTPIGMRSRARRKPSRARSISTTRPGANTSIGGRSRADSISRKIQPSDFTD